MGGLVEGADEGDTEILDDEAMAQAERRGLIDEANLHLFLLWYTTGGMNRGLTITELTTMPAALVIDFLYCLGRMSKLRKWNKNLTHDSAHATSHGHQRKRR